MKKGGNTSGSIRVELGDPVPFLGMKPTELLLAAALGAPAGTRDPADLALLSAASRHEDLRRYRQLEFLPLDPVLLCSTARVRQVDSDEEMFIARGDLDAILYLCRADTSTRYHADIEAGMKSLHGYRALGVARGKRRPDGIEDWSFLGYIPLRATRKKSLRSEAPVDFRYVPVWDWQLRTLHWLAMLLIIVLSISGLLMGDARLVLVDAEQNEIFFGAVRLVHFVAGWALLAAAILRIGGLFFASNRFQRWDALFPVKLRDLKNLFQVMLNYLLCRFDRGPHYIGHNPLQQVAYTGIYVVALGALLTGFTLYAQSTPDLWFSGYLLRFGYLVGFQTLRLVHLLIMYVFLAFIPIHVYLAIRADTVEREGAISSIISGGRWCRKGTHFEDGNNLPGGADTL